jgi:hypothetical protein
MVIYQKIKKGRKKGKNVHQQIVFVFLSFNKPLDKR